MRKFIEQFYSQENFAEGRIFQVYHKSSKQQKNAEAFKAFFKKKSNPIM